MTSPSPDSCLRVRDLRKWYADPEGHNTLIVSLDALDVARGESLVIEGASGSGKTTLLHMIAGIVRADEGTITICDEPMTGISETRRDVLRAKHIGYLFQTFNLLPGLSSLENVLLGMTFRPRPAGGTRAAARTALDRVGLSNRLHHRPSQLSVGQQQRVAIARAMAGDPSLVLADEPTSNLDAERGASCMDLLESFCAERNAALVVVTHDERVQRRFARSLRLVELEPAAERTSA